MFEKTSVFPKTNFQKVYTLFKKCEHCFKSVNTKKSVNISTLIWVWAGKKNFCSIAFLPWELHRKNHQPTTQLNNTHHHNGEPFATPRAWDIWICPIQCREPFGRG
jgi:hypothetical protein